MTDMQSGIAAAGVAMRAGRSSVSLTTACLEKVAAANDDLHVLVDLYAESALAAAAAADEEVRTGVDRGPLHGIPLGIKDVIATHEGPTRAGSRAWDESWHRTDAESVARLRAAGAIVVGKTVTLEFAAGMPAEGDTNPVGRNPWRQEAWAGGSSSGSASGLVSGMFLGSLGTDTGGSIRCPAAYCGVSGLKPTFGLVPTEGMIPWALTLDHVGPMGRTADDCALLLDAMAGPRAPRVAPLATLAGVRVGVVYADHLDTVLAEPDAIVAFEESIAVLADHGATLVPVTLPLYSQVVTASMVITPSEGYALHKDNLRARWDDYGHHTRMQISAGAVIGAAEYFQAQRMATLARERLRELMKGIDVLVMVTASTGAPEIADLYGIDLHEFIGGSIFTPYWCVLGNPALSIPSGRSARGLPLGLQLVGRPYEDFGLLAVADVYQRYTNWHTDAWADDAVRAGASLT